MADGSGETGSWTRARVDLIKKTVCPSGISDDEFALFIEQCKRSGLDPLLKEAFCVPRRQNIGSREKPNWVTKYEFQPSEAGMLARAERFPDYGGIQASAVFADDDIQMDLGRGEVSHRFNPAKRKGSLVGAWSKVARREKLPVVVWLDFSGYVQQTPLWGKIPNTMIEKCARVAALRKAYPEAFGGLYVREEMPAEEFPEEPAQARPVLSEKTATRETAEMAMGATPSRQPQPVEVLPPEKPERKAKSTPPREPVGSTDEVSSQATYAIDVDGLIAFGRHKMVERANATDVVLYEALAEGKETLARWPNAHNAPGVRRALESVEKELQWRGLPLAPPAEPKPLSQEAQSKAAEVAKALGGEVQSAMSADDIAALVVAEAEVVEKGEDFGRLVAKAKLLPNGTAPKKKAAAALKAAAKRLGIDEQPARQPGQEG